MSRMLKRTTTIYPETSYRNPKNRKITKKKSNAGINSNSRFQRSSLLEYKDFTTYSTSDNPGYDVTVCHFLNSIQSGATPNSMNGRQITMTSVLLSYSITIPPHVSTDLGNKSAETVRILLVYDKEPFGGVAGYNDILDSAGSSGSELYLAPRNLYNKDRFIVLYDKVHDFGINSYVTGELTYSAVAGPLQATVFNKYIKINLPCVGPATNTAGAGITTGSLLFLPISSASSASGPASINRAVRVRFTDA